MKSKFTRKYTIDDLILAIEKSNGFLTIAAKTLKIPLKQILAEKKRSKKLRLTIREARKKRYTEFEIEKRKENRWIGGSRPQHTTDELIRVINKSNGFLTVAANSLGITYQAIWNRQKRDKKLKRAIKAMREKHLDISEKKLLENIKKGKEHSIFFHLRCLGKDRGYVERREITGAEGKALQVSISIEDRLREIHKTREEEAKKAIERGEFVGNRIYDSN